MSGRPSRKSAEIGLFRPFSAFLGRNALFRRVRRAPGKSRKRRKKAFFLRYPRISLNPHLLNAHLQHPTCKGSLDFGALRSSLSTSLPRGPEAMHTEMETVLLRILLLYSHRHRQSNHAAICRGGGSMISESERVLTFACANSLFPPEELDLNRYRPKGVLPQRCSAHF